MRHGLDTSFLVAVEAACHPEHAAARCGGGGPAGPVTGL